LVRLTGVGGEFDEPDKSDIGSIESIKLLDSQVPEKFHPSRGMNISLVQVPRLTTTGPA
jgi:hypothetical protein